LQHFDEKTVNMIMERVERSPDLTQILEEIQNGNVDAFIKIIEEYKKLVAHIVFRMVGNPADREDLGQEIFIKVYQNLSKFRFESKFSTWISKIAYNTCLNFLNKKSTQISKTYASIEKDWDISLSNQLTPLSELEESELKNRLNQEIMNLPVHYRMAITLFHLQELSYQEISEIMNIPEGTVKSYLYRARQCLKEILEKEYQSQVVS
jgi:RNA polymerase sigma-70 factor (ECF subfamily)